MLYEVITLLGKKGGGQTEKKVDHGGHDQGIDEQVTPFAAERAADDSLVFMAAEVEAAVEPLEKTAEGAAFPGCLSP